jgi:hypothetical protein
MSRWSISSQLAAAQLSLAAAQLGQATTQAVSEARTDLLNQCREGELSFYDQLLRLQNALAENQLDMERIDALRLAMLVGISYLQARLDSDQSTTPTQAGAIQAAVQAWNLAWKVFQASYWAQS